MSAVLAPRPLSIEETSGVSYTEYRITGEFSLVIESIARLLGVYHPYGYGTRVAAIDHVSDGIFCARVTRANSCD